MQYADRHREVRSLLAGSLGAVLTPELAAQIEVTAFANPDSPINVAQFPCVWVDPYTLVVQHFIDVADELAPLHEAHWRETEKHRHGLELRPDYAYIFERDRRGSLVQIVARNDDTSVIGHLRLYLNRSLHTSTLYAEEDTLYILPEHRGGKLAMRMLRYAESVLASIGVKEIRANSKLVNRADVLMRRMKYEPVALQFVKFIGD